MSAEANNLLPAAPTTDTTPLEDGPPPEDPGELEAIAAARAADEAETRQRQEGPVTVADFYSYMPQRQFIFTPTRELWPTAAVNARCPPPRGEDGTPLTKRVTRKNKKGEEISEDVPLSPTEWVDQYRPVEQMTWAPGEPLLIHDRLVDHGGGWIERTGCNTFNLYMAPKIELGDPAKAQRWLDHIGRVFPDDIEHLIKWLAQRAQHPEDKINHALVLGGDQGTGKDTILEPMKYAVGPANFIEISAMTMLGRFNGFTKSVILRISEGRDLGEIDRYAFYEHLKIFTAAPPDVIRVDEKNLREHYVRNVMGVIITTNHKTMGIYLPEGDRRHYVAWSPRRREDFAPDYWTGIHRWFCAEGSRHVAAYLATVDLAGFDAKAPPPKTQAFYAIVDANRAPEDSEMADALDGLGNPPIVTIDDIAHHVLDDSFRCFLQDRRSSRQIPHRMETAGYVPIRNTHAKDGLWKLNGKRQVIYARKQLSTREQFQAAADRCRRNQPSR